ncbi:MAG: hypothetical protein H6564_12270 [Lewinellaceae bacterium]|nr:hypothetical protein [Lewinellaceae bacterium]
MNKLTLLLKRARGLGLRYYLWLILLFAGYRAVTLHARFFNGIIWSDAEGYYLYLPALFIHGGFEGLPVLTEAQFPMFPGTNKRLTRYTYGVALMQSPFFLAAHGLVKASGQDADGYSSLYRRAIQLAALLYGFLGLLLLKRALERHFRRGIVFLTVTGLYFGTNLFHYMVQEPGMSHIYSFFLFSLFLYFTPRFWSRPGAGIFTGMGMLLGLITLIRPTNLVVLLYLLLFDISSWQGLRERLQFIGRHFWKLLLAPLASLLVFIPQFAYWKYLSGHLLLWSYGDEGFTNWDQPRIDMVLFHIKNGWLLFSPMAGLSVLGCLFGSWKNRYNIAVISLILLISLYTFGSWWCWWFGGAFGHRSFVEFYTLLAFPYAWLVAWVWEQKKPVKIAFLLLWLTLIYYSYFLTVYYISPHYDWPRWRQVTDWMLHFRLGKKL